eukprot:CAMPEP_0175085854 /NCGR_PEP_ID=MMETSP0052_2-20121109/28906_1 /TAXON_ID=51329 ORGANISM="Polytomella parva, Strain SAG 63-3" /NCGR_SAMPLE_ID=MMETSP0052_2 /ASSEMBLY_ACC=CAM_ASM_000194 /LENGTH=401 /DNA_ID=CAMNT_0016357935 /DNA_START=282 /DNA_END=1484 /DNA_ORIENTATION=-
MRLANHGHGQDESVSGSNVVVGSNATDAVSISSGFYDPPFSIGKMESVSHPLNSSASAGASDAINNSNNGVQDLTCNNTRVPSPTNTISPLLVPPLSLEQPSTSKTICSVFPSSTATCASHNSFSSDSAGSNGIGTTTTTGNNNYVINAGTGGVVVVSPLGFPIVQNGLPLSPPLASAPTGVTNPALLSSCSSMDSAFPKLSTVASLPPSSFMDTTDIGTPIVTSSALPNTYSPVLPNTISPALPSPLPNPPPLLAPSPAPPLAAIAHPTSVASGPSNLPPFRSGPNMALGVPVSAIAASLRPSLMSLVPALSASAASSPSPLSLSLASSTPIITSGIPAPSGTVYNGFSQTGPNLIPVYVEFTPRFSSRGATSTGKTGEKKDGSTAQATRNANRLGLAND